jgi:hypothetical protein
MSIILCVGQVRTLLVPFRYAAAHALGMARLLRHRHLASSALLSLNHALACARAAQAARLPSSAKLLRDA